jgi:hypothetical protein
VTLTDDFNNVVKLQCESLHVEINWKISHPGLLDFPFFLFFSFFLFSEKEKREREKQNVLKYISSIIEMSIHNKLVV